MQSLILRNGPDEFYLLVLQRSVYNLMTADSISFVNMLNIIRAKKDLVGIGARDILLNGYIKLMAAIRCLPLRIIF